MQVRCMSQDEPKQAALATRLIEVELSAAEPGFISLVVVAELCWIRKSLYSASELLATVEDLLNTPRFHLDRRDMLAATLQYMKAGEGAKTGLVVQALIAQLAAAQGCSRTVSFDKVAVRSAGMVLLV
ncbi:MAG: VapC toxin family PIN domain ribonuclease [Polaromonas sp.]